MTPSGTTTIGRCSRRGAPSRTYIRPHNTTIVTQNYFHGIRRTCGHVHTGLAQKGPHKNVSPCHSSCSEADVCPSIVMHLLQSWVTALPQRILQDAAHTALRSVGVRLPELCLLEGNQTSSATRVTERGRSKSANIRIVMMMKAITLFGNDLDGTSQGHFPEWQKPRAPRDFRTSMLLSCLCSILATRRFLFGTDRQHGEGSLV